MLREFMYIQIREDELVPAFNIKFSQTLFKISSKYKFDDKVCLEIYMSAFGKKMGFLLRNKEPKTLHEAFNIARDIENNLKFGITKRFLSTVVSCQNIFNGEIPCKAEQNILCQESLLSMSIVSHSNDGIISGKFCDNADIDIC